MSKKINRILSKTQGHIPLTVDVACVIHGNTYDWQYVEKLYNMVTRNLPVDVKFHVYTEHDRSVPPHMVKHCLEDWAGVKGPKKSWWYKLQLFNPAHHSGDLLYFDLDMAIVKDISWLIENPTNMFWALRDFRYLQKYMHCGVNSSVMWFNVNRMSYVWDKFLADPVLNTVNRYQGDQDFINAVVPHADKRYFELDRVASFRWQILDGGWDFSQRRHRHPGRGIDVPERVSVIVFHGHPKPHQCSLPAMNDLWR